MSVNQPDGYQANNFGIKVSKPGINVNNASDSQLVYKDNFSTKTYYDQTNARIVEGLLPDGTYGMWVSKPGFNATDINAPSNNELVFNSNQDMFKIAAVRTITVNTPGSWSDNYVVATQAHGLSFLPAYMAFISLDNYWTSIGVTSTSNGPNPFIIGFTNASVSIQFSVQVDKTNIYFQAVNNVAGSFSATTNTAKVYLLQETAS